MGKGKTREDHKEVADQLIAAYAKGLDVRDLAVIVGEDALTEKDKAYLKFADAVENRFIKQDYYEERSIEESLDLAWELFTILPEEELTKIKPETLKKYHPKYRKK
jgi:V/A-type H+-transporting ATPase subunit B